MADTPWPGDACSLVDAFRAKELTPLEALDATLGAIEASELNAFCHLDPDAAREAARGADVSLPFGGVPVAVKELDGVAAWPLSYASLVFKDNVASHDATQVARLREAGAVLVGLTTSSEFGGVNCTTSRIHGTTRNPWNLERTPGGSSGGAAAAVSGGLITLSTAGDGGGSIRIPAGFCGLFGLKCTYGRIPKGPKAEIGNLTPVVGCLSRSVRDVARWLDVCNGFDARDPTSLPRVDGWEAGLGTRSLRGRRVAIAPTLGAAVVHPDVVAIVEEAASAMAEEAGLTVVDDVKVDLPPLGLEWAMSGLVGLLALLGDRYPAGADDLTPEIQFGMQAASQLYNLPSAASVERARQQLNEAMADVFEQVDFVVAATSPDVAFAAEGPLPTRVGDVDLMAEHGLERAFGNNGALTIPSNINGGPAVTIPAGTRDGLPVGVQVLGRHHEEALLLDLALACERARPWPVLAPGAPL